MINLPKGYIAVFNGEYSEETGFDFKGVSYAAEPGVNLFPTLQEALAVAVEIPDMVIEGLDYDSFDAPVVLFSPGEHNIDKTIISSPVVLLGSNAGINPNLPSEDGLEPVLNPLREENETKLTGSYWRGVITISGDEATKVVLDGFSEYMVRVQDGRNSGTKTRFSFRNLIHLSHCGKNLYAFGAPSAEGGIEREIEMKNVRLCGFDDLDYGGMFMRLCPSKVTLEGVCYAKTGQLFGFTDLARELPGCPANAERAEYVLKNCYFGDLSGDRELSFGKAAEGKSISIEIDGCVFNDASLPGRSPLSACVGEGSSLTVRDCVFRDTRGNQGGALSILGDGKIDFSGCSFEGYAAEIFREAPPPTDAPSVIICKEGDSGTEDSHKILTPSEDDIAALDALYSDTKVRWTDLHVHTDSGGTSDGKTPMKDFVPGMDALGLDVAAVVDHKQMRGFFLPEWDESRFIIGTEPGTKMLGLTQVRHGQASVHYNMLFPHKYSLALVLANFPEFEFRGDELGGSFKYPNFTKERFAELTKFVQSIGGIMVHPHPKTMLASDDPLDYSFGDRTFLETIYGSPASHASFKNYRLWKELLDLGEHILASGGSDTHAAVSNKAVAAIYTRERSGNECFLRMREGDLTVGNFGMQMLLDSRPMGSELENAAGKRLVLRVADVFAPSVKPGTAYELRIITDRGVAYAATFDGTPGQTVAIETQDRRFYRAEIFDLTHGYAVAIGNPVWTDGKIAGNNETEESE